VVKVVLSDQGEALYFSRQKLASFPDGTFLKHIGVYAYRRDVLQAFCQWEPAALELTENLEQLRALANGVRIQVAVVDEDTIAVDTPEDVERVEKALIERRQAAEKGSAN
jgi:3-deoxy-manno-octulosonate cytidylyltransferase (CMP-KDO synthetase)